MASLQVFEFSYQVFKRLQVSLAIKNKFSRLGMAFLGCCQIIVRLFRKHPSNRCVVHRHGGWVIDPSASRTSTLTVERPDFARNQSKAINGQSLERVAPEIDNIRVCVNNGNDMHQQVPPGHSIFLEHLFCFNFKAQRGGHFQSRLLNNGIAILTQAGMVPNDLQSPIAVHIQPHHSAALPKPVQQTRPTRTFSPAPSARACRSAH